MKSVGNNRTNTEEISIRISKTIDIACIACDFYDRWGFPNCLGSIDGKHVVIQAFPNHNSLTFNYKHTLSIVLMAVADADYTFILVDIGALGHNSDGGIFKNCKFGKAILENSEVMKFPGAKALPGTKILAPYVFLADEAFPLRKNIMRPYPGRSSGNMSAQEQNFNKNLSRARRIAENAFGILANRFRIYRKPIIASKETVTNIIKATVCLHNFFRERTSSQYMQPELVDREDIDGVVISGIMAKGK
ncbi:hypothetical protein DOY81_013550 [Sarcophaga bullata]|nr:hypothetical protein DOY81_013550 [Sarcophaga bullata]